MRWQIKCIDSRCRKRTRAQNIVDLLLSHRDENGWFLCECGKQGYIERHFRLQESGKTWKPFLRGIVPIEDPSETYKPFVFVVSYEPSGRATDLWFSYYKDLRRTGGRLKLGHGPGGPPVLGKKGLLRLLRQLKDIGYLSSNDIERVLR